MSTETTKRAAIPGTLPRLDQNRQHLGIYSLNRMLREIVQEIETDKKEARTYLNDEHLLLLPAVFNKQHRTFHFAAVQDPAWEDPGVLSELSGKEQEEQESHTQLDLDEMHVKYFDIPSHREHFIPGFLYSDLVNFSCFHHIKWFEGSRNYAYAGQVEGQLAPAYKGCSIDYGGGEVSQREIREQMGLSKDNMSKSTIALSRFLNAFQMQPGLRRNKNFNKAPILILPLWDTWVAGRGYGGIFGVVVLTIAKSNDGAKFEDHDNLLTKFKEECSKDFLQKCENLSEELSRAAAATIVGDPIEPPYDLAHHFVRALAHMQDWEHVTAYRGSERVFCFGRAEEGIKQVWSRCCEEEVCEFSGAPAGRRLSWKWEGFSIWNRKFVADLTEEEIAQYGDYTFVFHFPKTAVLPIDPRILEQYKSAILRQQMTVLGLLTPKVRVQRYALRQAVSGIMGRNMSHNIGSHVLARYSRDITFDGTVSDQPFDHRGEFLSFLQQRMDFLADVATADRALWSQSLPLQETLLELNYKDSKKRFMNQYGEWNEPVLLRYITGKSGLTATVKYKGEETYFACPSGRVGAHALYVITREHHP